MPDQQTINRVRAAYLDPIRSVLVIDDRFSQYDAQAPGAEIARARALWRACRNKGLLCDIDDGADLVGGQEAPHLLKSDLVILDYHLLGEDPKWALELLQKLAHSDYASIVVVYTVEPDISGVRRRIAAHLRGGIPKDRWFPTEEAADAWNRVAHELKYNPTEAVIEAYIADQRSVYLADPPLQAELRRLEVRGANVLPYVVRALFETLLVEKLGVTPGPPATHRPILGGGGQIPLWVFVSNLFVACVQKTAANEHDGGAVFSALENALFDWNPNFLLSAAAYARGEFARGGFRHERDALANPDLQAGWLFHAWGGSEHEREDRLRALFERVVTSYASRVLDKVIQFGMAYVPPCEKPGQTHETLREAIKHFHGDQPRPLTEVMHTLNEFLVIEDSRPYVETGTIFARSTDDLAGGEVYVYVCATPACDLVPRDPHVGSWESRIHPARPIIAIRGQLFNASEDYLSTAEQGRCVFVTVDGKKKAIVLIGEKSSVPVLEWYFLENMGKIGDNDMVEAFQVERSPVPVAQAAEAPQGQSPGAPALAAPAVVAAAPVPEAPAPPGPAAAPVPVPAAPAAPTLVNKPLHLRVLGQIRAIYASRILQYAGQHLSRIGVDFVNQPLDPEANKPKPKVANKPKPNKHG